MVMSKLEKVDLDHISFRMLEHHAKDCRHKMLDCFYELRLISDSATIACLILYF